MIQIVIDRNKLEGSVDLVGNEGQIFGIEAGKKILTERVPPNTLSHDSQLPDDSRLWAALQNVSGGTWGGCVFDVETIIKTLEAGTRAQKDLR